MSLHSTEQRVLIVEAQTWNHVSQREAQRCRVDENLHDLHGQPDCVQTLGDHFLREYRKELRKNKSNTLKQSGWDTSCAHRVGLAEFMA